jgi:type IX secretion system substrate protein
VRKRVFAVILIAGSSILLTALFGWSATYTVTSREDSGAGTLRQAILDANVAPGTDTINFNISNSITVYSTLVCGGPTIIEGGGTTVGSSNTSIIFYFSVNSSNTTVRQLCVVDGDIGIYSENANNITIVGCVIGTDWDDNTGRGNTEGLLLGGGSGHQVGGNTIAERNIICGNSNVGVNLTGTTLGVVQGNYIGLASDGVTAHANGTNGLQLTYSNQCLVGGDSSAGEGNIISGNANGVYLSQSACWGNSICGNVIGLNAAQSAAVANSYSGIFIYGAHGNFIGLPQVNYGNIISGNTERGIHTQNAATDCVVQNNIIGLNASGTAFPNTSGIYLYQASGFLIGGLQNTIYLQRNVISGNSGNGVYVANANSNTISGNFIGTNLAGTAAVANGAYGIYNNNANNNLFGGENLLLGDKRGNVVSGNASNGIMINGSGNTVAGNYVGLNVAGTTAVPNGSAGVYLQGGSLNLVGGRNQGSRQNGNVISGNSGNGVELLGNGAGQVAGNYIGLDADGETAIGNGTYGVFVFADNNIVGGNTAELRNYICGNSNLGISVYTNADHNTITGNYIGIDTAGALKLNGNNMSIQLSRAATNLITYNHCARQIMLYQDDTVGNTLVGNVIGMLPNGASTGSSYGITAYLGADHNYIGNNQPPADGNMIYSASTAGILIDGATTIGNTIFGNTIVACADPISLANGGNQNQTAPVIVSAVAGLAISGTAPGFCLIEVFVAEGVGNGGALRYVGQTNTIASTNWSVSAGTVSAGEYVTAICSNGTSYDSSDYCTNVLVVEATPTVTPTLTITPTGSPTLTASPTSTATPTISLTTTGTVTISPTATVTMTATPTATITPTYTATITSTPTPDNPLLNVDLKGKTTLPYPNPARDTMRFLMHFEQAADVVIEIYNLNGERIASIKQNFGAGRGQYAEWDCKNVAPGVYIARILINSELKETRKIAIVK